MPNSVDVKKLTYDQLLFLYVSKRVNIDNSYNEYILPTVEFLIQFIPFTGDALQQWKATRANAPKEDDLLEDNISTSSSDVKKEDNPYAQDYYSIQVGEMKIVKSPFEGNGDGKIKYKNIELDQEKLLNSVSWEDNEGIR